MLQKQLEFAQEREQFQREELKAKNEQLYAKDEQIQALQRLLGAPNKVEQPKHAEQVQDLTSEPIQQTLVPESKPIIQESQPASKRLGLFGRVIRAVLD